MERLEEQAEKNFERIHENDKKMLQLRQQVKSLKFQTARFEEIIQLIKESIKMLSDIQKHWMQLTLMFRTLSVLTEMMLGSQIESMIA